MLLYDEINFLIILVFSMIQAVEIFNLNLRKFLFKENVFWGIYKFEVKNIWGIIFFVKFREYSFEEYSFEEYSFEEYSFRENA